MSASSSAAAPLAVPTTLAPSPSPSSSLLVSPRTKSVNGSGDGGNGTKAGGLNIVNNNNGAPTPTAPSSVTSTMMSMPMDKISLPQQGVAPQPLSSLARLIFACESVWYVPPVLPHNSAGHHHHLSGGSVQQSLSSSQSPVAGASGNGRLWMSSTPTDTTHTTQQHRHHGHHHSTTSHRKSSSTVIGCGDGGSPYIQCGTSSLAKSTTLDTLLAVHPNIFPFIVKPHPNRYAIQVCFEVAKASPPQLEAVLFTSSSSASPATIKQSLEETKQQQTGSKSNRSDPPPQGGPTVIDGPTSLSSSSSPIPVNHEIPSLLTGIHQQHLHLASEDTGGGGGSSSRHISGPTTGFKPEAYTLRHHIEALVSASQCSLIHKHDEVQSKLRHLNVFRQYISASEVVLAKHRAQLSQLRQELSLSTLGMQQTQRTLASVRVQVFYLLAHMPLPTLLAAASVFQFGSPYTTSLKGDDPRNVSATVASSSITSWGSNLRNGLVVGDLSCSSNPIGGGPLPSASIHIATHPMVDPLVSALVNLVLPCRSTTRTPSGMKTGDGSTPSPATAQPSSMSPTRIAEDLSAFQLECFNAALQCLKGYNQSSEGSVNTHQFTVAWACAGWCVAQYLEATPQQQHLSSETTSSTSTASGRVASSISSLQQLAKAFTDDLRSLCGKVMDLAAFLSNDVATGSRAVTMETILAIQRLSIDVQWELHKGGHSIQASPDEGSSSSTLPSSTHSFPLLVSTANEYLSLLHKCTIHLPVAHPLTASLTINTADSLCHLSKHHLDISAALLGCPCNESDDDDGHVHVSAAAVDDEEEGEHQHTTDNDYSIPQAKKGYSSLFDNAQRFGGCLRASKRYAAILPDLTPSDGAAHGDLSRLLADAGISVLEQYIRLVQVSLPTRHAEAIQYLPASTYELIRVIEGAIGSMRQQEEEERDIVKGGARGGADDWELSLSNARSVCLRSVYNM